jgi:hypothetical protein
MGTNERYSTIFLIFFNSLTSKSSQNRDWVAHMWPDRYTTLQAQATAYTNTYFASTRSTSCLLCKCKLLLLFIEAIFLNLRCSPFALQVLVEYFP